LSAWGLGSLAAGAATCRLPLCVVATALRGAAPATPTGPRDDSLDSTSGGGPHRDPLQPDYPDRTISSTSSNDADSCRAALIEAALCPSNHLSCSAAASLLLMYSPHIHPPLLMAFPAGNDLRSPVITRAYPGATFLASMQVDGPCQPRSSRPCPAKQSIATFPRNSQPRRLQLTHPLPAPICSTCATRRWRLLGNPTLRAPSAPLSPAPSASPLQRRQPQRPCRGR